VGHLLRREVIRVVQHRLHRNPRALHQQSAGYLARNYFIA
jgi:hypothetical protein